MRIRPAKCANDPSSAPRYPSPRLVLTAAIAVLAGSFHFGFQLAILNPMAEVLQRFLISAFESRYHMTISESLQRVIWSSIAASLFIGAAVGAWIGASLTNRKGPASTVIVAAFILAVSIPLSAVAYFVNSCELFMLSRLVTGIGIGLGTTAQGVLLSEISPVEHRGFICSFSGFGTDVGFIFASFIGLPDILGQDTNWHLAYLIAGTASIVALFYFIIFAHESPVYLMRKGKYSNACKSALAYSNETAAITRIEEIKQELSRVAKVCTMQEIFGDRVSRRVILLSTALNAAVSFSGITAMSFFGTFLLTQLGFSERKAALANCFATLAGIAGSITATLVVEKVGRRLLVIGSLLSLALINTLMMMLELLYESTNWTGLGYVFLLIFAAFLYMFGAGAGPAAWFLGAELSCQDTRARVQAASIGMQYLTCFLSPIIFFPLQRWVGAYSFLLFIVPLSAASAFFYRCLPETRRKSSEEIHSEMRNSLSKVNRSSA